MKNIVNNSIEFILYCIGSNKDSYEKIKESKTIDEVYEIFKEYGYKGNIKDFSKELAELLINVKNISESELDKVSGGKFSYQKGFAGMLSALTVLSSNLPSSSAMEANKIKESSSSLSINQLLAAGAGGLAIGAVLGNIAKNLISPSKLSLDLEVLKCSTKEGIEFQNKMEELVNAIKNSDGSDMMLVASKYSDTVNYSVVSASNSIFCNKFKEVYASFDSFIENNNIPSCNVGLLGGGRKIFSTLRTNKDVASFLNKSMNLENNNIAIFDSIRLIVGKINTAIEGFDLEKLDPEQLNEIKTIHLWINLLDYDIKKSLRYFPLLVDICESSDKMSAKVQEFEKLYPKAKRLKLEFNRSFACASLLPRKTKPKSLKDSVNSVKKECKKS